MEAVSRSGAAGSGGFHLSKSEYRNQLRKHVGLFKEHRSTILEEGVDTALSHDPHQLHGNLGIAWWTNVVWPWDGQCT